MKNLRIFKPRRVLVSMELETDLSLESLKEVIKSQWCKGDLKQIQVNVIKPPRTSVRNRRG